MSNNVKTHASISIYLETRPETPITIGDIRRWLQLVDSYALPDTLELTTAVLDLDLDRKTIEPIDCGDCSPQLIRRDIIVNMHTCSPSMRFNYGSYSEAE